MSSEGAQQILDTSIDAFGISTVTSSKNADTPRQGLIYDPVNLAAGRLIHIHPSPANYTALFRERWFHGCTVQNRWRFGQGPRDRNHQRLLLHGAFGSDQLRVIGGPVTGQ
jgi:hypothetical protein